MYWSFSFCISPSSEYSGVISFRIDLFDLLYKGLTRFIVVTVIIVRIVMSRDMVIIVQHIFRLCPQHFLFSWP